MAEVHTWSGTAADNNSSPPDGAPEGMAPSAVNDVIREVMAAIKRKDDDENGALVTGGSATAYTVATPNRTIAAYENGLRLRVRLHTATGAAPTLNVNSLGAVRLAWPHNPAGGGALTPNQVPGGGLLEVVYRSSHGAAATPAWVVLTPRDHYDARRRIGPAFAGVVDMHTTGYVSSAGVALTLPASSAYQAGDEVILVAGAGTDSFTIAPAGADIIEWSDYPVATVAASPRSFGGSLYTPRACTIRHMQSGLWYGFVHAGLHDDLA